MIVIGRDHKLYYEAYNDASDLEQRRRARHALQGLRAQDPRRPRRRESPYKIDYYGYFDSYKCYAYTTDRFWDPPALSAASRPAPAADWSGDYLNYLTTSRIDALRKVLYGGDRSSRHDVRRPSSSAPTSRRTRTAGARNTTPAVDGYNIADYTPLERAGIGKPPFVRQHDTARHSASGSTLYADAPLLRVRLDLGSTVRIWNWVSKERPVAPSRYACDQRHHANRCRAITDYDRAREGVQDRPARDRTARVQLHRCSPDGDYKPTGIIQDYGDGANPRMFFGLMTGSYSKNTSGGVLRRPMGQATTPDRRDRSGNGSVPTSTASSARSIACIHRIRHQATATRAAGTIRRTPAFTEGECQMWGNPIAEIMYEGLRYLAGRNQPRPLSPRRSAPAKKDSYLAAACRSTPRWDDPVLPYPDQPSCAKPFETVISDINPSYDSDQLPGSAFGRLNHATICRAHWTWPRSARRSGIMNSARQSKRLHRHRVESSPAPQSMARRRQDGDQLRQHPRPRPEEPTKQGSYYSASVAYHGHERHQATGRVIRR